MFNIFELPLKKYIRNFAFDFQTFLLSEKIYKIGKKDFLHFFFLDNVNVVHFL